MLEAPGTELIGLSLLHFVWQGCVVGAGSWWVLRSLRGANARYAAACLSLLLLVSLPVVTYARLAVGPAAQGSGTRTDAEGAANTQPTANPLPQTIGTTRAVQPPRIKVNLTAYLPYLVLGWLVGALLFSLKLVGGYLALRRLRTRHVRPFPEALQICAVELRRRLGLKREVGLFTSSLAQVPFVSGVLKPVILLPVSVVTGLTPKELEFVIIHELAHVKRWDYPVNLLQGVAETLLFYHPVVWWVNRVIRQEREHGCDDVAVRLCGDAAGYAKTLTRLETLRQTPHLALSSNGGSLMKRVQKILNVGQAPTNQPLNWFTVLVTLGLVVGLAVPFLQQSAAAQKSGVDTSDTAEIRITLVGDVTPQFGPESYGFEVGNPDSYAVFEVVQNGESRKMEFVSYETPQGSRSRVETRSKQFLNGAENADNWLGWFIAYMDQISVAVDNLQKSGTADTAATMRLADDTTLTFLNVEKHSSLLGKLKLGTDEGLREKLAKQALDHGVIDEAGYKLLMSETGSSREDTSSTRSP